MFRELEDLTLINSYGTHIMSTVIKQVDVLMTPVLATGLISPAVTAQHQSPRVAPAAGGQSRRPPLEPGCAGGSLIILKDLHQVLSVNGLNQLVSVTLDQCHGISDCTLHSKDVPGSARN